MAIQQYELRTAGANRSVQRGSGPAAGQRTAFLCHSHIDQVLALGLQALLRQHGMDLYIDWQDATMPQRPSKETAQALRTRIRNCEWFLFLATRNSMSSRWCPWELGHADGIKANSKILLVPTGDGSETHGAEYLDLYIRVEFASDRRMAAFSPGATSGTYVSYL